MPGMLGIAHQMANFTKQNCILLRKTRSKILCSPEGSHFPAENKEDYMLQIKNLSIIHKKDLCVILNDFSCVLNDGDKAVIIGEEGNGKSTLLK